jgi:hypothetical protein
VFTNPRKKEKLFFMGPCFQGFKNIYKIKISQICDIAKLANFSKKLANFELL